MGYQKITHSIHTVSAVCGQYRVLTTYCVGVSKCGSFTLSLAVTYNVDLVSNSECCNHSCSRGLKNLMNNFSKDIEICILQQTPLKIALHYPTCKLTWLKTVSSFVNQRQSHEVCVNSFWKGKLIMNDIEYERLDLDTNSKSCESEFEISRYTDKKKHLVILKKFTHLHKFCTVHRDASRWPTETFKQNKAHSRTHHSGRSVHRHRPGAKLKLW